MKKGDTINDFGFTTFTDEEVTKKELDNTSVDIIKLEKLIMPLLENLAKDGDDRPNIHWPNRKKPVQDLMNQIQEITGKYK